LRLLRYNVIMSEKQNKSDKVAAFLEQLGFDDQTVRRITAGIDRTLRPTEPRLHSTLTIHEAQDWLAANDPAGADYWRSQKPDVDMIAAVGEQLMLANASRQLLFDRDWQERYLRGEVSG
jgi:hypothetical protein